MAADTDLLTLTAEIVSAYVGHTRVQPDELPALIRSVRATLAEDTSTPPQEEAPTPEKPSRAQIRKSITPDALISFVDGRPYKTLKRHLALAGMTMAEYRERYGLPDDYPAILPAYSASRSAMSKALGLGRKSPVVMPAAPPAPKPAPPAEPAPAPKTARTGRRKAKPAGAAESADATADDAATPS